MKLISTWLTIITLLGFSGDIETQVNSAVESYYDSLLVNKAIDWKIFVKRCNIPRGKDIQIINVHGENGNRIPRGSRLCWVNLIVDGKERSIPVTLAVHPREMLPVATAAIPPRTELNEKMIEWRLLDTSTLGAAVIPDLEDLTKLWTKVTIPKGAIIESKRLRTIPAIFIGKEISLISRIGAVEIKAPAKALEDGRIGEKIRIENSLNGKRMYGIVESEETVVLK